MTDLRFKGFDALRVKAQQLTIDVRERLAVNAARAGAKVIAERAKEIVSRSDDPTTGRQIAKNIGTQYRKKRSQATGDTIVSVGVRYPKGRMAPGIPDDGVNTNHWHLLELGTEHMAAQPFLVPAALSTQSEVITAIQENLSRGLDRELKKL